MNQDSATAEAPSVLVNAGDRTNLSVIAAMKVARVAQSEWSRAPLPQRLRLIRELRGLIAEHAGELAEASSLPRRRPALESLTAEVLPLAEACRFLEREAGRILAARRLGRRGRPIWLAGVNCEIRREPIGVVLVIGPGNYPLLLPGVQMIQALAAGNAVMLKPGAGGRAAADALAHLIVDAGFDPRLVSVLSESTDAARSAISARPDKVLFTGSAATGEKILSQLAPHLIPSTMELSGSDAVIVCSDADLDLTAKALSFGLNLNGGATCISPKRVFVHQDIARELEERLSKAVRSAVNKGGENCLASTGSVQPLIRDALDRGAYFLAGDKRAEGPVILGGVDPASRVLEEDIFAPLLALVTVRDVPEALYRANRSPWALAASIFSRDTSKARELAAKIKVGFVTINDLIIPTADARLPFGGRGRSGFGVTRGAEGLLDLTTPKVVTISRSRFRPAFDPARCGDQAIFCAYAKLAHGRSLKERVAALSSLTRNIFSRNKLRKENR